MKQKFFNAISILALAGCSLALVNAGGQGPLGPFATRLVKADSTGALNVVGVGACSTLGPFTLGSSVLVKADSTGALQVCGDNLGGGSVSDTAYGVGWNGDTTTAPSKNAVYDKIETVLAGGGLGTTDIDTSAEIATIVGDETGTTLLVFNTSPTFATSIIIGTAGVSVAEDGDGAITFLGRGNGADEDLTFNFDDTANSVVVSTSTGVTNIVFTSIDLSVADEAYDATNWNGSLEVPTKNAVRDILETFVTITDADDGDHLLFLDDSAGTVVKMAATMNGLSISGTTLSLDSTYDATFNSLSLEAAGVKISGDDDGAITFLGLGNGNDEDLTLNLDDTSNTGVFSSSTGLATLDFGGFTLTNFSYNVESTGNTFTDTVKYHYNTAVCQGSTASLGLSGLTALLPTATCYTGTNITKGWALFPDSDGAFELQGELLLPSDWTGAVDVNGVWRTAATANDIKIYITVACTADAEVFNDTWVAAGNTVETAKGTTLQLNTWAISGLTTTGCAAGEVMHWRLYRSRADAADSLADTFQLGPITFTARRAK